MAVVQVEISVTTGPKGQIELAYIRLGKARVAKTVEIEDDRLLADYDRHNKLVGIEILAPVKTITLRNIVSATQLAAIERALPDALKAA